MKQYKSSQSFQKYKPYKSSWQKIKERLSKKNSETRLRQESSASYRNNFGKPRGQSWKGVGLFFKLAILLSVIFFWVWYVAYSPYFRIESITYYNLKDIPKTEIENIVRSQYLDNWKLVPRDNYFLINTGRIENIIKDKFLVDSVTVTRKFPDKLEIEINEKPGSAIYDNGRQYFLLDDAGNVIKILWNAGSGDSGPLANLATTDSLSLIDLPGAATSTAIIHIPDYKKIKLMYSNYPILYDLRTPVIENKQKNIISGEIIASLSAWQKGLAKQGIGTPLYFVMNNPFSGIISKTTNNWDIVFNPAANATSTLAIIKEVLQKNKPAKYIDIRFPEGSKIFWK